MKKLKKVRKKRRPEIIGWREYVALPDLGIELMRAKIDTGARTSALHATSQERFTLDGEEWVRFHVPKSGRGRGETVTAKLLDIRSIKNTSGIPETRLIIRTTLLLGRHVWHVEVSLADRAKMEFELILGRTAVRGRRVVVDPGHSYLVERPKALKKIIKTPEISN